MDHHTIQPDTIAARLHVLANRIKRDHLTARSAYFTAALDDLDSVKAWARALDAPTVSVLRLDTGDIHLTLTDRDAEDARTNLDFDFLDQPTSTPYITYVFTPDVCPLHGKDCTCGLVGGAGELAQAGTRVTR